MPSTRQHDTVTPEAFLAGYPPNVQAIADSLPDRFEMKKEVDALW